MPRLAKKYSVLIALVLTVPLSTGCSSFSTQRNTIEPCGVPTIRDGGYRSNKVPINFIRLRQDPPEVYILGEGDTLGIYIEGILSAGRGGAETKDVAPIPVIQPPEGSGLSPAIGYPVPVRKDGTISLPLVPPIKVEGMTLAQTEEEIKRAYTVYQRILPKDNAKIMVSLVRPKTFQVMVIREDTRATVGSSETGKQITIGNERRGATSLVELRRYENDVLHALMESGGLPGLEAKNEIVILRGGFNSAVGENSVIMPDFSMLMGESIDPRVERNILRIPLRVTPGEPVPVISEQDIILTDGDVVFIQSRDAEVFYTGGLLVGGQHPIPRDYDLDVFGAIAMAGGSIAAAAGGSGTVNQPGRGGVGSIFPPTRVIVLRQVNGCQRAYRLDVRDAMFDPSKRILIEPNDIILLEYTPSQLMANMILNNFEVRFSLDSLWN